MAATSTPTYDSDAYLGANPGIDRLYDNVQAEVAGASLAQVKMAVWNTIENFYIRSTARREHVYWQMSAGVNQVNFDPFDGNWSVAWILHFTGLNHAKIEPPGLLRDVQYPPSASLRSGQALLSLRPFGIDSDFGPMLFTYWFDTVLDGALARLYEQPGRPYSSLPLAQFHGRRFMAGVARARDIARREWTDGPGRWAYPYFARGRVKN